MENYQKRGLSLFWVICFMAFSVSGYASSVVEEKKSAANFDETLPAAGETSQAEPVLEAKVSSVAVSSTQKEAVPAAPAGTLATPAVAQGKLIPATATQAVPVAAPVLPPKVEAAKPVEIVRTEKKVVAPENPSGMVIISGYKYPVYLFVPKNYKTDQTYSMIMIAPAEDIKAEKQIEYLSGLAQRKSAFILAPYVLWPKKGDTPYELDAWLLTVKRDVSERFPIDKKRIYLVGKDTGAQYAAYLATKHAKEFSAVALLGEAWAGPFSQLVLLHSDAPDQVPFFIALKADGNAKARNQVWFDKFQKKGYLLHLEEYKSDDVLADIDFKKTVFDWLETTSQNWQASVAQRQQTWKGKIRKGIRDFFAV